MITLLTCGSTSIFAACNENMNQMELNFCSMDEYKKADRELNQVYTAYMSKLDAARKQQVKAVQQNWIKYKESDCTYVASAYEGGSIQPLIENSCLTEKTKLRTKELKEYLKEENR